MARRPKDATPRPTRRDRLIEDSKHDVYKSKRKPKEPTTCSDCGAVFRDGRWTWVSGAGLPAGERCPACQRILDHYPAGIVTLRGEFQLEHRDELLGIARNVEEREKAEHPLKRIMESRREQGSLVITTTDMHLARSIGDAIHHAYEGELDYEYVKEGTVLRVEWRR
jgi:NMD protein affecting ribosome stability and mRNA decay